MLRGRIINLITGREEATLKQVKDSLEVRKCLMNYGRYLEKNGLEDTVSTYEDFIVNYLN